MLQKLTDSKFRNFLSKSTQIFVYQKRGTIR